jgi:hypothetical protein
MKSCIFNNIPYKERREKRSSIKRDNYGNFLDFIRDKIVLFGKSCEHF